MIEKIDTAKIASRRVVTHVPGAQAEEFAAKIADKIPHLFGQYDSVCWWSAPKTEAGTEQFRPLDGEIETIPSVRMEFSIPDADSAENAFINEIRAHHPWKEPVILIFKADIVKP